MKNIVPSQRLHVVDSLRGMAVMAILLVHSLEHFIYPVYPEPASQPAWLNALDQGVFSVIFTLFAGKAYAVFALLFGFTFYIQYTNQEKKGKDFGLRFLWRLLLLMAFATLNSAFFPGGDVLLLFAFVGTVLVLVRKWNARAILVFAVFMLIQPVEWYHFIMGKVQMGYSLPDLGVGELYKEVEVATGTGNWADFLWTNITVGQQASLFWAIGAGRVLQTAGLFMLGYLLGKKQLFMDSESNTRFWIKALIIAAIMYAPVHQLKTQVQDIKELSQTIGVVLDMWQNFAFTVILVSSFVLVFRFGKFKFITDQLAFYGRMSLTNYVGQSIIGALIFFPIGFNLAPYTGYTLSLIIGGMVFMAQLIFCKWWLKAHKQGPLESIWHKWTWISTKK